MDNTTSRTKPEPRSAGTIVRPGTLVQLPLQPGRLSRVDHEARRSIRATGLIIGDPSQARVRRAADRDVVQSIPTNGRKVVAGVDARSGARNVVRRFEPALAPVIRRRRRRRRP